MDKRIILLVGPPGSGKSTVANQTHYDFVRVSQDDQGKDGHRKIFKEALMQGRNIVIDRMGFSKEQRERYLKPAKEAGYETEIIVIHESHSTCLNRMKQRQSHPTIKDEQTARKALDFFFSKYERVQDNEADRITRMWPEGTKPYAIICDLDGTLCNCEHRRHFVNPDVKPEGFKKNWKAFFDGISNDLINMFCYDILQSMAEKGHKIVFASGRDDNYKRTTTEWLKKYRCVNFNFEAGVPDFYLYMRPRNDNRQDYIVKEIILDFEILTRFTPYFMLDDRDQVVQMWRKRGFTCLQVANGDF